MTIGIPTGLSEEDVAELVDSTPASSLFRAGTSTSSPAISVGQVYGFSSGADEIIGDDIVALGGGLYRLAEGTYELEAVIRVGLYSNTGMYLAFKFRNDTDGVYIGTESACYANANTNTYTHNPVLAAQIIVPAGQTKDVGIFLLNQSAGGSYVVSEKRSFISMFRVI